jgi:hypothetical protein
LGSGEAGVAIFFGIRRHFCGLAALHVAALESEVFTSLTMEQPPVS